MAHGLEGSWLTAWRGHDSRPGGAPVTAPLSPHPNAAPCHPLSPPATPPPCPPIPPHHIPWPTLPPSPLLTCHDLLTPTHLS